jgi:mannose-6-phosphate isomerase
VTEPDRYPARNLRRGVASSAPVPSARRSPISTVSGTFTASADGAAGGVPLDPAELVDCSVPRLMANSVRHYDWGSLTALAQLQRRPASGRHEAELWMGAHPSAPSSVLAADGAEMSLLDAVDSAPQLLLGPDVQARFGQRLPFLLKVLAIARPLSVQVHPDAERAHRGFHDEESVTGTHRYVDPWPKPEMLYALRPTDALCGFRSADRADELLRLVEGPLIGRLRETLGSGGDEHDRIKAAFTRLITWPAEERAALVQELVTNSRAFIRSAGFAGLDPDARCALIWVGRLARYHPADPLVAAPLLLDLVRLPPGGTLYVPAGAPHAYLDGLGVEVMGNSDNVLRAGLTHKPIAVEELLQVVDGGTRTVRDLPMEQLGPDEVAWRSPAPEFRLGRLRLDGSRAVRAAAAVSGPQIFLCTSGRVRVGDVLLQSGESAFVGASAGPVVLQGAGEVFRASVAPA